MSASYTYCQGRKISSLKYLTLHVNCHLTVQGERKFAVIVYLGLLSNIIVWQLVDIIPFSRLLILAVLKILDFSGWKILKYSFCCQSAIHSKGVRKNYQRRRLNWYFLVQRLCHRMTDNGQPANSHSTLLWIIHLMWQQTHWSNAGAFPGISYTPIHWSFCYH